MNRMKEKDIVQVGKDTVNLKGFKIENNGRVGTLTYYIFRHIIHSIFYCLSSLKVMTNEDGMSILNTKTPEETKTLLLQRQEEDIAYLKKALNLENKIYGWIYGIHEHFFDLSRDFKTHYARYSNELQERSNTLANQLMAQIKDQKVSQKYFALYTDMANSLNNGLITKQVNATNDMTSKNRFTRDAFEDLL